jgi:aldehyde dehydrogenase (NAD+)
MAPHTQLFINNEYVDAKSGETLSVYSPHDESLVADNIQVAGQEDVDAAVAAARAAFKGGEWSKFTPAQRSAVMLKFADLLEKNSAELGLWESKSMGMPAGIAGWMLKLTATVFRCEYHSALTCKDREDEY